MPKTIKIVAFLAILNLIVFGACFYLFANIKNIDKAVSARLTQTESAVKKDESLRSIKNLMNDTKKEREQIAGFFVQPNGTVDFIEAVESLGGMTGVKIEIDSVGVEALKNKTASSAESFRLSLKTEGSWSNTMRLLSLLENMPYKISFEKVNLGKISGGSGTNSGGEQAPSYWRGTFSFTVLKIKNLPEETSAKSD